MPKGWKPILPTTIAILRTKERTQKAKKELSTFGSDLLKACKDYEAPPSARYKRTLTLSRSWAKEGPRQKGNSIEVAVVSSGKIAPYNFAVKGSKKGPKKYRQSKRMAKRGWLSVDDIVANLWPATERELEKILGRA